MVHFGFLPFFHFPFFPFAGFGFGLGPLLLVGLIVWLAVGLWQDTPAPVPAISGAAGE